MAPPVQGLRGAARSIRGNGHPGRNPPHAPPPRPSQSQATARPITFKTGCKLICGLHACVVMAFTGRVCSGWPRRDRQNWRSSTTARVTTDPYNGKKAGHAGQGENRIYNGAGLPDDMEDSMDEDRLNMDIRKFLKVVGVTSQRE